MEAMDASGSWLCQIIQGAGLRPRTAQRFQTVLATAGIVALADTGFASRMDDMMVNSIRKFTAVNKRADDLAVLLQPARPGSSLPANLIDLHGDELFQALVAMQVPEVAMKNVHLEAALAAQRLAMQETVDLHIHVYEEIVYIGHYKASEDRKTLAFFQWLNLWTPLFRSTSTWPRKSLLLRRRSVGRRPESRRWTSPMDASLLLASCNQHCIASWP